MSIRFLADADLNLAIVEGVRRLEPAIDFKSANEARLTRVRDPQVLELSATEGRVLVSHDSSSMPVHFEARIRAGRKHPGMLLTFQVVPVSLVIQSILIVWSLADEAELADQIHYLPSLTRHCFR